jgi:RHS repeat-associated protein
LPLTTYLYSGESFDFNIGQQYLRARFYDATTGRFNRLDPFAGNSSDPQSFHKYAYVHGDPISHVDPTGKFAGLLIGVGIQMMLPGPGDFIRSGIEALVKAYVVNLEWDVEWALDMNMADNLGSRLDDDWVYAALGNGLHDSFNISTPFGTINPLDVFGGGSFERSGGTAFSAGRPRGAPARMFFGGGGRASFSFTKTFTTLGRSGVQTISTVGYYTSKALGHLAVLRFSPRDIAHKGTNPASRSHLMDPVSSARNADFSEATAQLKADIKNGKLSGRGYTFVRDKVFINGVEMTWHHHIKKGQMQLVTRELHEATQAGGNHIGMSYWWR